MARFRLLIYKQYGVSSTKSLCLSIPIWGQTLLESIEVNIFRGDLVSESLRKAVKTRQAGTELG